MAKPVPPHVPSDEEVWDAVEALVATFERAAEIAPALRARLEEARGLRDEGRRWPEMIEPGRGPMLITATNDMLDDLVNVGARLRRLVAQGLYAEGMTMDAIASTFGVTRQRVSTLVNANAEESHAPWKRSGPAPAAT